MEIPKNWKIKTFEELFEFKNGVNADKSSYGGGVKFVNVMEVIYNDCITIDKISGAVKIREDQKKLYSVVNGDVLFNRTSETTEDIGLSAVFKGDGEVTFGGFVIRGRSKGNEIDNEFKKYCFRSDNIRKQIIVRGQGAVRSNIGQGDLQTVSVILPPLPEQQKIATILSKWDELIEQQTQLIVAKEKRKKGLMQKLLTGEVRFSEFKGEWEEVKLKELVKKSKGNIVEQNEEKKGRPVIDTTSFNGAPQMFTEDNEANVCLETDVLLLWDGSKAGKAMTGKVGVVGSTFSVLKPSSKIDHYYLCYHLTFNVGRIMNVREGSGIPHVPKDFLDWYRINLPDIKEQKKVTSLLLKLSDEIHSLKDELKTIKLQKKGLMQQLLTGKIRVKGLK